MANSNEKTVVSGYTRFLSLPGEVNFGGRDTIEVHLGDAVAVADDDQVHRLVLALGTVPGTAFQSYDRPGITPVVITPTVFNRAPASILLVKRTGEGALTEVEVLDRLASYGIPSVIVERGTTEGSVVDFYSLLVIVP